MSLLVATLVALLQPAAGGWNADPLFGPPPRVAISATATALPAGWKVTGHSHAAAWHSRVLRPGSQGYIGVCSS